MKSQKNIYIFFSVFLLIVVAIFFENCGQSINLQPESTAVVTNINVNDFGDFCAPAAISVPIPEKISIIIDMSASNVSEFSYNPGYDYLAGKSLWFLGQAAISAGAQQGATVAPATDLNGIRFSSMLNYINTCQSSRSQYAIIGFSDMALEDTTSQQTCQSPFVPQSTALQTVSGLQNLQTTEVSSSQGGIASYNYPFLMDNTSYQNAFTCLQQRVANDLDPTSVQKNYKVIFLTDGKPSDLSPQGGFLDNSVYVQQLKGIQQILTSNGFTMSFQAIYYGPQDEFSASPADPTLAQPRLDAISAAINGTKADGSPLYPTLQISQDDPSLGAKLQSSFCNTQNNSVTVGYSIDHIQLYPLTSRQIGNSLYADQDMDGLNDDWEQAQASLGFSLSNSRSQGGVLDSLCYLNLQSCKDFVAGKPSCDPTKKVGFGFNECDQQFVNQKIINLAQNPGAKPFDGIDYDGDGVLDYIELIKGTNMFVSDMNENPSGDGISNGTKLSQGLDPNSYSSSAIVQQYGEIISFSNQTSCSSQEGVHLSASNLPFVDVPAYHDPNGILPDHAANENVFVIIYFAKSAAYSTNFQIFRQYLFIEKDGSFHLDPTGPISVGTVPQGSSS